MLLTFHDLAPVPLARPVLGQNKVLCRGDKAAINNSLLSLLIESQLFVSLVLELYTIRTTTLRYEYTHTFISFTHTNDYRSYLLDRSSPCTPSFLVPTAAAPWCARSRLGSRPCPSPWQTLYTRRRGRNRQRTKRCYNY